MNFYARTSAVVLLGIFLSQPIWAQTFKIACELEGIIPALEDRKLKPEKVVVEIQTMGKNLFMKVVGSNFYTVQASSLTTEEFVGKNLTSEKLMGVTRKHKATGFESEDSNRTRNGHDDSIQRHGLPRQNGSCALIGSLCSALTQSDLARAFSVNQTNTKNLCTIQ
jgi:hypothetical protein